MLRSCRICGKQYEGDPGTSCCSDCVKKQRSTSVKSRFCQICGRSFDGGPAARYCPECRRERKQEADRRFKKNGPMRKLGSEDKCIVCGKTYIVCGSKQRYCPDCALEAIRRIDNAQSLAWEVEYAPPEKRKEIRHAAAVPITCVICGEQFSPTDGAKTCSQACSVALSRRRNKEFEASHREERRAYHNNRRKAKEAEKNETKKGCC